MDICRKHGIGTASSSVQDGVRNTDLLVMVGGWGGDKSLEFDLEHNDSESFVFVSYIHLANSLQEVLWKWRAILQSD